MSSSGPGFRPPVSSACVVGLACAALVASVGCYGAAPPTPVTVPLPEIAAGVPIEVHTESDTQFENVEKKSVTCPQGHVEGSPACIVTRYHVREPVTRTDTTARYGDTPLNMAQFRVMTDPDYDKKRAELAAHSAACQGANVPRWIGAGAALAGVVLFAAGQSNRAVSTTGLVLLGGGAGSYAAGYYVFGGRRCHEAERLYRQLDLRTSLELTSDSGAARADEMKTLADDFNRRHAVHAAQR